MTKEEAQAKLDALIQGKVEEALQAIKEELTKSRRERVAWFYAGYEAGLRDDRAGVSPLGNPYTPEQRKTRAAVQYAYDTTER